MNKVLTDKLLTVEETMQRYPGHAGRDRITRQTLYNWLADPQLNFPRPCFIRKTCYFRLSDLQAFENRFQNRWRARSDEHVAA